MGYSHRVNLLYLLTHHLYNANTLLYYFFDSICIYFYRLACRCATEAKARGYTHFGLQFYGECYSGKNAESQYSKYGQSNECVKKDGKACDDEDTSRCVGKANANYVYRV
jgi:hypothetical protein